MSKLYGTKTCETCGGSGFDGRGTGYDSVCSNCQGGLQPIFSLREWIHFNLTTPYSPFRIYIRKKWNKLNALPCPKCKCKEVKHDNYYYDDHSIVEYSILCKNCGHPMGQWAYGHVQEPMTYTEDMVFRFYHTWLGRKYYNWKWKKIRNKRK